MRAGKADPRSRPGYVLIAVLIVIVVLSLAAYQFTEVMTSEYRAAVRTNDVAQARLAAVSGIHYAAGLLADRDSLATTLGGNPYDNPAFIDVVVRANPTNPRMEARFSLVSVVKTGGGVAGYEPRNGVIDEAGKLNINAIIQLDPTGQLLHDALMLLPNMTEDVADAIVDWVDADQDPRPNGAESDYYGALANGYKCKDGPLNSLDELLLVKGVTPQLLYGNDRNRNGLPDDDPAGASQFDRGWAEYLTVYGRELNTDSTGALRVYLDQDDMPTLYQQLQQAVGAELAAYIVAYKIFQTVGSTTTAGGTGMSGATGTGGGSGSGTGGGSGQGQNQPQQGSLSDLTTAVESQLQNGATSRRKIGTSRNGYSVLSLLNTQVTIPAQQQQQGQGQQGQQGQQQPTLVYPCPLNDPNQLAQLLPTVMDKTTARADIELIPRINVNTAPKEVLMALTAANTAAGAASALAAAAGGSGSGTTGSGTTGGTSTPSTGLAEADIDNLITQRGSLDPNDPATTTGAWLVTVGGISPSVYKNIEQYITGRTMVYRIQAIGYFGQGGPVARVEAVVDTNQGAPRFLYFRDLSDLDNPRGFEPPRR